MLPRISARSSPLIARSGPHPAPPRLPCRRASFPTGRSTTPWAARCSARGAPGRRWQSPRARTDLWSDDELRAAGVAAPTAREMGHLPVGGSGGSLELLPPLDAKRVVLVHINNTNPILCRSSAERARVEAAGIVVGEDAMEFEL